MSSSAKIAAVPLPWWTSRSITATCSSARWRAVPLGLHQARRDGDVVEHAVAASPASALAWCVPPPRLALTPPSAPSDSAMRAAAIVAPTDQTRARRPAPASTRSRSRAGARRSACRRARRRCSPGRAPAPVRPRWPAPPMRSSMPRGSASTRRRSRPYLPIGKRCPGGSGRMCGSKWKAITSRCTNGDALEGHPLKHAAVQQRRLQKPDAALYFVPCCTAANEFCGAMQPSFHPTKPRRSIHADR